MIIYRRFPRPLLQVRTMIDSHNSLIPIAAELRANGESWEAIGKAVNRHPDTVRHWPIRFPNFWHQHFRAAENRNIASVSTEAQAVLIQVMREGSNREKIAAASVLYRGRLAMLGKDQGEDASLEELDDDLPDECHETAQDRAVRAAAHKSASPATPSKKPENDKPGNNDPDGSRDKGEHSRGTVPNGTGSTLTAEPISLIPNAWTDIATFLTAGISPSFEGDDLRDVIEAPTLRAATRNPGDPPPRAKAAAPHRSARASPPTVPRRPR
jgi:hypothetical protein